MSTSESSGERDREKWNRRYTDSCSVGLPGEPSGWLVRHRSLLRQQPRGRALDVACGGGRNALYLADLGFAVDAWDISDVASENLADEAERSGLDVTVRRCDLTRVAFPAQAYEIVVNFNYLERSLFPALARALVPGGLLLFESFLVETAVEQLRPMDPRYLLEPGELRVAFPSLRVLDYREETGRPGRAGSRATASLVARRAVAEGRTAR